jgi:hypothetical protein
MSKRRIKVTIYIVIELHDKKTRAFLREAYSEASFYFTIPNAPVDAEPEDLVTDSMIHTRMNEFFEKQEALSQLKAKYPNLPDFYIGKGRMATQKVFFEEA